MQPEQLKKNLLDVVERIRKQNLAEKTEDAIPTSETIYKKILSDLCNSEAQCVEFLRVLNECHYLFSFNIVEADERLMIDSIRGFVVAETNVIRKLRTHADQFLERAFEHQFYSRKAASTIMRETIGSARQHNNTPFGKALNVSIMLEQYEHLLFAEVAAYSDATKEGLLNDVIKLRSDASDPGVDFGADLPAPAPSSSSKRAVDSPEGATATAMHQDGKWNEAVQKYGTEFLVRIHFRKYEFDKVLWLLKTGRITQEKDLRFVRDTLRIMEGRTSTDPGLVPHLARMADVRRYAQIRLNQIRSGASPQLEV